MANFKITTNVTGNRLVIDRYNQETIEVMGSTEKKFNNVKDTDGWLSVSFDKIGKPMYIVCDSPNAKIKITTNEPAENVIGVGGYNQFKFSSAFADTITGIEVGTDSTENVDISISVYGV